MLTDTHRGIGFIIYDANNLPVQAYLTNGQQLVYETDVYGNRVRNTISGTSDNFYFYGTDGKTEVVCNLPYSSNLTYNILGNAGDNIGQVKVVSQSPTRYYYLKDHLGSIKVTVNTAGAVVGYDDYYPYGMQMSGRSLTASEDGRYKFTGKERDASNGLDYFGARYYDSWNGRWNQVDPLASKCPYLSPYNFAKNSPMVFIDPNGESAWNICNNWTPEMIKKYREYAQHRSMEYKDNGIERTCEDFALSVLIDFASSNGLPITITTGEDKNTETFSASSDDFKDVESFRNTVLTHAGAPDLQNSKNTIGVGSNNIEAGDMLLETKDERAHHVLLVTYVAQSYIEIYQGNSGYLNRIPGTSRLLDAGNPNSIFYTGRNVTRGAIYFNSGTYINRETGKTESNFMESEHIQIKSWNFKGF